jgi:hypothetical protein
MARAPWGSAATCVILGHLAVLAALRWAPALARLRGDGGALQRAPWRVEAPHAGDAAAGPPYLHPLLAAEGPDGAADGAADGVVGGASAALAFAPGGAPAAGGDGERPLRVEIPDPEMRQQRTALDAYLSSPAFSAARAAAASPPPGRRRGIVINAGGRRPASGLAVTLRVLRRHLNCTLPVEVFWHGAGEMDAQTMSDLNSEFGGVTGQDILALPPAPHHRNLCAGRSG